MMLLFLGIIGILVFCISWCVFILLFIVLIVFVLGLIKVMLYFLYIEVNWLFLDKKLNFGWIVLVLVIIAVFKIVWIFK